MLLRTGYKSCRQSKWSRNYLVKWKNTWFSVIFECYLAYVPLRDPTRSQLTAQPPWDFRSSTNPHSTDLSTSYHRLQRTKNRDNWSGIIRTPMMLMTFAIVAVLGQFFARFRLSPQAIDDIDDGEDLVSSVASTAAIPPPIAHTRIR